MPGHIRVLMQKIDTNLQNIDYSLAACFANVVDGSSPKRRKY